MTSSQIHVHFTSPRDFIPSQPFVPPDVLKLQVSSSESVASDRDLEIHSASEVVTSQLNSKDEGIPLGWMKVGFRWVVEDLAPFGKWQK